MDFEIHNYYYLEINYKYIDKVNCLNNLIYYEFVKCFSFNLNLNLNIII